MRYAVETLMGCEWENCWTEGDKDEPLTFPTLEEAQAALLEFLDEVADAAAAGIMADGYDPADYRVVRVMEGD